MSDDDGRLTYRKIESLRHSCAIACARVAVRFFLPCRDPAAATEGRARTWHHAAWSKSRSDASGPSGFTRNGFLRQSFTPDSRSKAYAQRSRN